MAQTRRRAREAREAARRAEVEAAARKREKAARRRALVPRVTRTTKPRRYGALSTLERVRLLAAFLGVQVLVWLFVSDWGARSVLAVLTAACIAVAVKTRRSPPR